LKFHRANKEAISKHNPCPVSPNMIPNKNGNDTTVNRPGFASL